MTDARLEWEAEHGQGVADHLKKLKELRIKRHAQLELDLGEANTPTRISRREIRGREIDKLFSEYQEWIRETMITEDKPFFRIAAVLWGGE